LKFFDAHNDAAYRDPSDARKRCRVPGPNAKLSGGPGPLQRQVRLLVCKAREANATHPTTPAYALDFSGL
jgi:hypothetical protein